MAKRSQEFAVEVLVEDWITINRKQDPVAWTAWHDWRRAEMGSCIEPENFTVPSPFPPATVAAAKEYLAIVQQIRKSIGWNSGRASLQTNVTAWRA